MSITIKLFTQILNELVGWAQTHADEFDDFNDGATMKTLLEALAFEVDFSNLQIEAAQNAAAIDSASGVDLDLKVADYGVVRKPAVQAAGTLQFTLAAVAPAEGFTVPAGTVVSTVAQFNPYDAIEYTTQADLVIAAGLTSGLTGALANVAGAAGNQAEEAITVLVTSISGVLAVENTTSFSGGTDAETDASLRTRGKAAFLAVTNDREQAFRAAVLAVSGMQAVAVAGFGDPVMTRDNGQGGKVDIYTQIAENLQTAVEIFTYNPASLSGDYRFSPFVYAPPAFNVLRNVPVRSITSVENLTTAAVISASNYELENDDTVFALSDRAQDTLHWLSTAGLSSGDQIRVTFVYNAAIAAARQAAETKRGATLDLMVKEATPTPVNVSMVVNGNVGQDPVVLKATLETVLSQYLNSRLLNQDILQAVLVILIGRYNGVQNVSLPLQVLSTGVSGVSDIIVDKAHYVVAGTVQVTVLAPLDIQ